MDKLFAFDPGGTTGWALFTYADGQVVDKGQVDFASIFDWLNDMEGHLPTTIAIVVEDFRLMGGKAKAQTGSRFETVQVIGAIRQWASKYHTHILLQPPSIKPIAERWTGLHPVGSHANSHWVDAVNHGSYYLRQVGHYTTKLEGGGYIA